MSVPSMAEQVLHWNSWVSQAKGWERERDNQRRRVHVLEHVSAAVARLNRRPEILDVACGTGWLSRELAAMGSVTGLDLADQVITELRGAHPHIKWLAGDFLETPIEGRFDVVTCLEAISCVMDQAAFAKRIANLTNVGGTVVLTTHNPYIWNRTSWLTPKGTGQIRNWIPKRRLLRLFAPYFKITTLTTCAPSGDRGLVKLFNNHVSVKVGNTILGGERWARLRERCGLGCSFVLVGTRI